VAGFREQGRQLLLQVDLGEVKARFHGRQGDVQDFSGFLIRVAFEFMQDQGGLLLFGQRSNRLSNELPSLIQFPWGLRIDRTGHIKITGASIDLGSCFAPALVAVSVELM